MNFELGIFVAGLVDGWDAARHVTCKFSWSKDDDDQLYKGKGKLNIATSQGSSSRRGKKEGRGWNINVHDLRRDKGGKGIVQTILWHEWNLVSSWEFVKRGEWRVSSCVWIKYLQRYFLNDVISLNAFNDRESSINSIIVDPLIVTFIAIGSMDQLLLPVSFNFFSLEK